MTRTYLDAGVVIAVGTARDLAIRQAAIAIVDDPNRQFVASDFLRLEVLPKALYHRRAGEAAIYEAFFRRVVAWAGPLDRVAEVAFAEASRSGLGVMDALHVAAALHLGAEELITTERPTKPIFRVTGIKVVSIHPDAAVVP